MPGRGPQTFKKRQKEQQRKEKQQEKMAKRLERKNRPAGSENEVEEEPEEFLPVTPEELARAMGEDIS